MCSSDLRSNPTGESFLHPAVTAQLSLREFATQKELLPVARDAARGLYDTLNAAYFTRTASKEDLKGEAPVPMADPFTLEEVNALGTALFSFQSTFSSELPQANIYYVTRKCAYDTAILMESGEYVLPEGTLDSLNESKEKVLKVVAKPHKHFLMVIMMQATSMKARNMLK